jgi:hypothetical protein
MLSLTMPLGLTAAKCAVPTANIAGFRQRRARGSAGTRRCCTRGYAKRAARRGNTASAGGATGYTRGRTPAPVPQPAPPPPTFVSPSAVDAERTNDAIATEPAFPTFADMRAGSAEAPTAYAEPSVPRGGLLDDAPAQSHFAHEPPFKARRNPAKIWTMAAVALAILVAAIGGAISYFGMPEIGLSSAAAEPDLTIVLNDNLELNEREDGTPYFIASGSIVNPTAVEQNVPEMLVTLKDASGRSVYSWKMKAKTRALGPGEKVDFSEARLDVPLAAKEISVGWVLSGE